eukprot:TRINITY_DN58281_c0_g1_i1.p1 TRINITY_DN58281_c0_g1~~TRINITY_DN58281_c0_g1_i1.p1  ORF type:complete len:391 (-),score=30.01 TRINITY_DN58281_c0_g1_i1:269-1396(-)
MDYLQSLKWSVSTCATRRGIPVDSAWVDQPYQSVAAWPTAFTYAGSSQKLNSSKALLEFPQAHTVPQPTLPVNAWPSRYYAAPQPISSSFVPKPQDPFLYSPSTTVCACCQRIVALQETLPPVQYPQTSPLLHNNAHPIPNSHPEARPPCSTPLTPLTAPPSNLKRDQSADAADDFAAETSLLRTIAAARVNQCPLQRQWTMYQDTWEMTKDGPELQELRAVATVSGLPDLWLMIGKYPAIEVDLNCSQYLFAAGNMPTYAHQINGGHLAARTSDALTGSYVYFLLLHAVVFELFPYADLIAGLNFIRKPSSVTIKLWIVDSHAKSAIAGIRAYMLEITKIITKRVRFSPHRHVLTTMRRKLESRGARDAMPCLL